MNNVIIIFGWVLFCGCDVIMLWFLNKDIFIYGFFYKIIIVYFNFFCRFWYNKLFMLFFCELLIGYSNEFVKLLKFVEM